MKKMLLALGGLLLSLSCAAQTFTVQNLVVNGTFTSSHNISLSSLATQAANTVVANVTGSSASPTAVSIPSCSTSSSALQYTSATGFSCGTVAMSGANSNITSLTGLTTPLSVAQGGTGTNVATLYNVAVGATTNIGYVTPTATSGIPLVSQGSAAYPAFTTAVPAGGGTGLTTVTAHNVMVGEGTSNVAVIAPSATTGVALVSQGSSSDPAFSTVVPAGGGTGLTTITAHNVMVGEGTSNVTPVAPSATTGVALVSQGSSSDPAFGTVNIASSSAVTGTLAVANGGTGITSFGTGVATALGQNVTGSGGIVLATSPTITTPAITGLTGGSCASSGNVGQCASSNIPSGSAISLTTGTATNITSLALTAGNWLVGGNICFSPAGTTVSNFNLATLNTTSATLPTTPAQGAENIVSAAIVASNGTFCLPVGTTFYTVSGSTTVYLIAFSNFATSTMTGYGYEWAIRFN